MQRSTQRHSPQNTWLGNLTMHQNQFQNEDHISNEKTNNKHQFKIFPKYSTNTWQTTIQYVSQNIQLTHRNHQLFFFLSLNHHVQSKKPNRYTEPDKGGTFEKESKGFRDGKARGSAAILPHVPLPFLLLTFPPIHNLASFPIWLSPTPPPAGTINSKSLLIPESPNQSMKTPPNPSSTGGRPPIDETEETLVTARRPRHVWMDRSADGGKRYDQEEQERDWME